MADLFSIIEDNMQLDSLFQLQFMMFAEILAGYMLCRLKIVSSSNGKALFACGK